MATHEYIYLSIYYIFIIIYDLVNSVYLSVYKISHWLSISMGTHEIPWVPMDLLIDVGAACRTLPTALQHHEIHHYIFSNANENQWDPMGPR